MLQPSSFASTAKLPHLTYACCTAIRPSTRTATTAAARAAFTIVRPSSSPSSHQFRTFTTTRRTSLKEYFPPPADAPSIRKTPPSWHHPVYTEEQMENIVVAHRAAQTWSDWMALAAVRVLRFGMDTATGYRHENAKEDKRIRDTKSLTTSPDHGVANSWFKMDERKWLVRMIFLESVAGVPGMVGGMLRHLHSLRRMKRDNGWIETLLEEAANERMHLLTFLKLAEPGWFMRVMILGAQGVFFNGFFLAYLMSPRTCHRFVGYLEEEAVITYSRAIKDVESGKLPKWADEGIQAPEIAVQYWKMPEGKRTMRDLLLYIRADEAKHREVNHTMANLEQRNDPNPFLSEYIDPAKPHPTKSLDNLKPTGWERKDVM